MKLRLLAATVAALTLSAGMAVAQDTASEKGKLSYYFGYDFGRSLADSGEPLDVNTLVKAVQDGYAKKQPAVNVDQLRPAVEAFQKRQQAKAQAAKAEFDKAAAENKTKSDGFLAQNKAKAGVKTLPNGVQYRVVENGTGAKPTAASTVSLEVGGPYPWGQHPPQGDKAQSMPSIAIKVGSGNGENCGKTLRISLPALRSAVSRTISARGWRSSIRTSSEPV